MYSIEERKQGGDNTVVFQEGAWSTLPIKEFRI